MGTFYNSTYFFAGLVLLTIAGTVMAARRAPLVATLLTLWWLPFFVLYIFVVRYPGTHFYLLMESWSLLAAVPLAALVTGRATVWRGLVWTGVGVWLIVSVFYLYLLFFRQSPEYLVHIDRDRVRLVLGTLPHAGEAALRLSHPGGLEDAGRAGRVGLSPGDVCGQRRCVVAAPLVSDAL